MSLNTFDVVIILFFWFFFKWLFRFFALIAIGKVAVALKSKGKDILKEAAEGAKNV